jgi:hypothetical protein
MSSAILLLSDLLAGSAAAVTSLSVGARQRSIIRRLGMSAESFDLRRVKKLDGIDM